MRKKKESSLPLRFEPGAPDTEAEKTEERAGTLADLFLRYRREGWSDSEIEMGIAGQ